MPISWEGAPEYVINPGSSRGSWQARQAWIADHYKGKSTSWHGINYEPRGIGRPDSDLDLAAEADKADTWNAIAETIFAGSQQADTAMIDAYRQLYTARLSGAAAGAAQMEDVRAQQAAASGLSPEIVRRQTLAARTGAQQTLATQKAEDDFAYQQGLASLIKGTAGEIASLEQTGVQSRDAADAALRAAHAAEDAADQGFGGQIGGLVGGIAGSFLGPAGAIVGAGLGAGAGGAIGGGGTAGVIQGAGMGIGAGSALNSGGWFGQAPPLNGGWSPAMTPDQYGWYQSLYGGGSYPGVYPKYTSPYPH